MTKLPAQIRITVGEMFAKYDKNQNGLLERDQIKLALSDIFKKLGVDTLATQNDVNNFIKDYDKNGDGKISWADFANMYAISFFGTYPQKHLPHEISINIDDIFLKYDKDKNNTLDQAQLTQCLQDVFDKLGVNQKANELDVKNFFKDYDVNKDGKITREDFKKVYAINFHSF